ncbi:tape measure domain protein, partial [Escherichia coli EC1735]
MLRGEEFNSVNESGDRIVRALAAGMGVARK